jgi:hypothetical protein
MAPSMNWFEWFCNIHGYVEKDYVPWVYAAGGLIVIIIVCIFTIICARSLMGTIIHVNAAGIGSLPRHH